jgi:hypothetical protein
MNDTHLSPEDFNRFVAQLPEEARECFRAATTPRDLVCPKEPCEEVAFAAATGQSGPPALLVLTTERLYVVRCDPATTMLLSQTCCHRTTVTATVDGDDLRVTHHTDSEQCFIQVKPKHAAAAIANKLDEKPTLPGNSPGLTDDLRTMQW